MLGGKTIASMVEAVAIRFLTSFFQCSRPRAAKLIHLILEAWTQTFNAWDASRMHSLTTPWVLALLPRPLDFFISFRPNTKNPYSFVPL